MDLIFEYVTSVIKMDETDYADQKSVRQHNRLADRVRSIAGEIDHMNSTIGNLRSATHSAIIFCLINHREDRHNAHISSTMVLAFAFGAVMGSILLRSLGAYSICCCSSIMLICFILMFFSSPEI